MQAFLWRHLVPAKDLKACVVEPTDDDSKPRRKRQEKAEAPAPAKPGAKPAFTKAQVAGRLRQLERLFEEKLLSEEFYRDRVAECEAAQ